MMSTKMPLDSATPSKAPSEKKWWKEAVAYQIYPRSFMDSNGDGIGDLQGIISKLDYLKNLGVDVIWICPMYKSPQDDNGYDISDYQDIHHEYGTMADFDRLLQEAHSRGMKLLIDLVINHTSDEHPWFIESRSSRQSKKRDWYIWRDGKNGREPNNWESIFGGSAWKYDDKTQQYYLHVFSAKQPDLNWENLEMRQEVYKMMRWWMDRGVDGFRVDAISHMKKTPGLGDLPNPDNLPYVPSYAGHMNIEGIQDYLEDICKETFRHYDIMTVGEANGVTAEQAEAWVAEKHRKLNMVFQFEHLSLWDTNPESRMDLAKVKQVFTRWQKGLQDKGWNALYVENHDIPRIVSKWGDTEKHWRESATAIASMYFLMQGTPFIYQGQEIGMTNTTFSGPEDFNDVLAKNTFAQKRREGLTDSQIVQELAPVSRDNSRTPMQWSASRNAGFSSGRPWLKVNPNFERINVESQLEDPGSILNFYRRLIQVRKTHPVFVEGEYDLVLESHPQIYAYVRKGVDQNALVITNMTSRASHVDLEKIRVSSEQLLLSNYDVERHDFTEKLDFRPYESRIYQYNIE